MCQMTAKLPFDLHLTQTGQRDRFPRTGAGPSLDRELAAGASRDLSRPWAIPRPADASPEDAEASQQKLGARLLDQASRPASTARTPARPLAAAAWRPAEGEGRERELLARPDVRAPISARGAQAMASVDPERRNRAVPQLRFTDRPGRRGARAKKADEPDASCGIPQS